MLMNFDRMGGFRWILVLITVLAMMFLILPVAFIVALSFGSSQWLAFPPPGWTLRWYHDFFADPRWLAAIWTSAKIGVLVMMSTTVLALLTSFSLVRGRFRGRETLRAAFLTPMILPVVVVAVALYAFFLKIGLNGTLLGFVIAHTILALPFAIIPISSALASFDESVEDAAVICGASRWEARVRVTLPGIRHGLYAAMVFSFLVSWDEVVVAIFMASPTLQTLPVRIWSALRQDLSPVIAAASSILILLTLLLMLLSALLRKMVGR